MEKNKPMPTTLDGVWKRGDNVFFVTDTKIVDRTNVGWRVYGSLMVLRGLFETEVTVKLLSVMPKRAYVIFIRSRRVSAMPGAEWIFEGAVLEIQKSRVKIDLW